jgi:DNA-3-methyladenine glycosylase I
MEAYHDLEWGVPVHDDRGMFEHLVLEAFQSGLSWRTVLHKREAFRAALHGFDPERLIGFTDAERAAFLANPAVIRNRLKLDATLHNARNLLEFQQRRGQGFADFLWEFVGGKPLDGQREGSWPATTPQSDELAKVMKSNGFKFVGSTTLYAHMQATGMINDHWMSCPRYAEIKALGQTP